MIDNISFNKFLQRITSAIHQQTFICLTLSVSQNKEVLKSKAKLMNLSSGVVLQFEKQLTEGRLIHENIHLDDIEKYLSEQTSQFHNMTWRHSSGGTGQLLISKNDKYTYIEDMKLKEIIFTGNMSNFEYLPTNNREKKHLLTGKEDFLIKLGISDTTGRVHDKKQGKFKQICRFCELVQDIIPHLPKEGTIRIADLCSGKSYLSFAVYYCFTHIFQRDIEMTCIDLKESVMNDCALIAKSLKYDKMSFLTMNIENYQPVHHPHLVISLHACDFATDIVLRYAASIRADVILSTPCCQRELKNQIKNEFLSFVTDYGLLSDKLCTVLTDAMRLKYLNALGYTTSAIELIDPESTPKNVMLRAIKESDNLFEKKYKQFAKDYQTIHQSLTGTIDQKFDLLFSNILLDHLESIPG